jgi:hypothetical protein
MAGRLPAAVLDAAASTAGFAQPAGFAGAEQRSANPPLRPAPTIDAVDTSGAALQVSRGGKKAPAKVLGGFYRAGADSGGGLFCCWRPLRLCSG